MLIYFRKLFYWVFIWIAGYSESKPWLIVVSKPKSFFNSQVITHSFNSQVIISKCWFSAKLYQIFDVWSKFGPSTNFFYRQIFDISSNLKKNFNYWRKFLVWTNISIFKFFWPTFNYWPKLGFLLLFHPLTKFTAWTFFTLTSWELIR